MLAVRHALSTGCVIDNQAPLQRVNEPPRRPLSMVGIFASSDLSPVWLSGAACCYVDVITQYSVRLGARNRALKAGT